MVEWIMADALRAIASVVAIAVVVFTAGIWVGSVNSDRKSFKELMHEVRNDIKSILNRLPPEHTVQSSSPVSLTEFGKKISDSVSAKTWGKPPRAGPGGESIGERGIRYLRDMR